MKKVFVSLLSCLFLFPLLVHATAGACSDHGGVMCSVGPDTFDESVVCNDNWSDSTVNYWNADECRSNLCPAQQTLRDMLILEADDILKVGSFSVCDSLEIVTTGVEGYANLDTCFDLQETERNRVYNDINTMVDSVRYTCKSEANVSTTCSYPNSYLADDNLCYCNQGYVWNSDMTACELPVVETATVQTTTSPFTDVGNYTKYKDAVLYLNSIGVVNGYPDGSFKPGDLINRAEFSKILIGAKFGIPTQENDYQCFPDVLAGQWYTGYVCKAKTEGIIDGYPDGSFKPDQNINYVEALKIVSEAYFDNIPINPDGGDWYQKYWQFAKDKGFFLSEWTGSGYMPSTLITREQMSEMIYQVSK